MYIKQVVIRGFMSYKEVEIKDLCPTINGVVGQTGAGKSNLFHAIRFVIGDLFGNSPEEHIRAILSEEAGYEDPSAFVELLFDNSDHYILVDAEQVCLCRRLNTKKDEYILNGKPITKSGAMQLLNKDGVSRNNLCYVVHHGKISSLTLMDDSGRLDLLKEISRAQFYEKQRLKSSNILRRSENERNQIHDLSQFLNERLRVLDEQRTKLKDYEQQMSILEYCIYSKELLKAAEYLEDANLVPLMQKSLDSNLISEKEELRNLSSSLDAIKTQVGLQEEAKNLLQLVIKKHTELSNDIKFLDNQICQDEEAEKELSNLSSAITRSKDSLEKIMAGYTDDATSIMSCRMKFIKLQKHDLVTLDTSKDCSGEWLKELSKKCHHQVLWSYARAHKYCNIMDFPSFISQVKNTYFEN